MIIETKNLRLISGDREIIESALAGNVELAKKLNVDVHEHWTLFGEVALHFSLEKLNNSAENKDWLVYFLVHRTDNMLVGSCGYKGKPDSDGSVEIGYEIAPEYRNRGYATEMARGLIDNAFKDERVKVVIAHTLANENPSTSVLKKCGFVKVGEVVDPEEGVIWRWSLKRDYWK